MNKYFIDEKFYSPEYIKKSVEAFKEYTNIDYNEWILIIYDELWHREIFFEFMNYLIWISNQ